MYCSQCGKQTGESDKFCHACGKSLQKIQVETGASSEKRTPFNNNAELLKNKFVSTITKREAKEYIRRLRLLFVLAFVFSIVLRGGAESSEVRQEVYYFLFIAILCFYGYFIYYCALVLKREEQSGFSALLCVFFAPISWLWLYPSIINPLLVITGEREAPKPLSKEKREALERKNKKFYRNFIIIVGVIFLLFMMLLTIFALM